MVPVSNLISSLDTETGDKLQTGTGKKVKFIFLEFKKIFLCRQNLLKYSKCKMHLS